jgi:hypothetical protein
MMIPCPICHLPMETNHPNGRIRKFCSMRCLGLYNQKRVQYVEPADPVAVIRLIDGDAPAVTNVSERIEAAKCLSSYGWSLGQIADHMHTSKRAISRYRSL